MKTTIHIKLKKFTAQDFSSYFKLVNDEKVMEMITERAIPEKEARIDYAKIIQNNTLHQDFGHFMIMDCKDNEFLGLAKLEIKNETDDFAEIGYMILPQFWRKGIAATATKQLIEEAKKQKQLTSLLAIIDPKNLPSRKILLNNGFESKCFKDFDGLAGELLALTL